MGYSTIGYIIKLSTGMSTSLRSKEYQNMTKRLKEVRLRLGLSQVEVAQKLKKPQSYISKTENGERRIDATELASLAKIYKRNITFFLS